MNDYDFRQLSDKEFEVFCCDLLGREMTNRFERFKPGRDGGVDGRYFRGSDEIVLQCKHWLNTPLSKLLTSLSKIEAPKLRNLRPSRYMLAISHPLSRTDKKKICEIFSPYIRSPADIFGKEDLNDILSRHEDVERRHYKLWIASSNVLTAILNAPIYGRSDFLIQDIVSESVRYVVTKNHEAAHAKLEEKRVIIVTGEAGIGKTTLARNILLPYLADGYELFSVGENIAEADGVFKKEVKQIFYFDDFLGSNYLDAISGTSGAQVVQFMRRVKADRLKRFVLTSRTTILNQGRILIGALSSQNTSRDEFEISLQSLSRLDKAKILYNHIWHSGLGDEFKDEIYKEKRYKAVVDHKNYNPRIVSYVTDIQRLDDVPAAHYWTHIVQMLDNPADVWNHPFDAQHDDYGRSLVLLVALNGRPISQRELADAYYRYVSSPDFSSVRGQQSFLVNLRHLCGSMLTRLVYGASESLTLFNPSIRDFIIARFRHDPRVLRAIFCALRTEDSLSAIHGMMAGGFVTKAFFRDLLVSIARDAHESEYVDYSPSYVARLYMFLNEVIGASAIKDQLPLESAALFIEREDLPLSFEEVLDFLLLARGLGIDAPKSVDRLVSQACEREPNYNELARLVKFIKSSSCSIDAMHVFRQAVGSLLCDQVYEEFPADEVFEGLLWDEDMWEAKLKLKEMISEKLEEFGFLGDEELAEEIADSFDFDDQARTYFMGSGDSSVEGTSARTMDMVDDVDDLFDRS